MNEIMDTQGGGWKSRKLAIVLLAMILILAGGILCMYSVGFTGVYAMYIGGVLGAAGLYFTGNVTGKVLAGKVNASVKVAEIKSAKQSLVSTVKPVINDGE